jgi:methionyl aminopeptidase
MVTIKTPAEIEILREGGRRLSLILKQIVLASRPGVSADSLNDLAYSLTKAGGDEPAFLNYRSGREKPYPASLCLSINDEIVHGLSNLKDKILKEGDIASLDMGLIHGGLYTDSAVTIPIGEVDEQAQKLMAVTKEALKIGIKEARAGKRVGDIGFAIEKYLKPFGFGIVKELAGHGVGYAVHEDPYIPNYGKKGKGELLKEGMVIAIEPMVNEGTAKIVIDEDGFTYKTADGKRSAHFEHTIVIRHGDPEVLTA